MKSTPSPEKSKVGIGPPEQIAQRIQTFLTHSTSRPPQQRPKQYLAWATHRLKQLEELFSLVQTTGAPPEMIQKLARAIGLAEAQVNAAKRRLQ